MDLLMVFWGPKSWLEGSCLLTRDTSDEVQISEMNLSEKTAALLVSIYIRASFSILNYFLWFSKPTSLRFSMGPELIGEGGGLISLAIFRAPGSGGNQTPDNSRSVEVLDGDRGACSAAAAETSQRQRRPLPKTDVRAFFFLSAFADQVCSLLHIHLRCVFCTLCHMLQWLQLTKAQQWAVLQLRETVGQTEILKHFSAFTMNKSTAGFKKISIKKTRCFNSKQPVQFIHTCIIAPSAAKRGIKLTIVVLGAPTHWTILINYPFLGGV